MAASASAQTCALPGWDGAANPSGIVNSYHGGAGSVAAGATSLNVASLTGQRTLGRALQAGDMVMVMQMQDSGTPANAGRHEYAQVVAVAGTTLQLNRPLTNSYTQLMNAGSVRSWQVVWVPQYASATITGSVAADRWTINALSGVATGGVVAFDVAGSLALSGTVTAAGSGFRGGLGLNGAGTRAGGTYTDANYTFDPLNLNGGLKGEGIEGTPQRVFDGTLASPNYALLLGQGYALGAAGREARSNAGGAGNDGDPAAVSGNGQNQLNAGGGGGGNGGPGGRGGNAWNQNSTGGILNQPAGGNTGNEAGGLGGNAIANAPTRLVMGGGGGAGTANNGSADGITAWPPTDSGTVANGGAGAITSSGSTGGGVVMVRAGTITGSGAFDASGYRAFNKSPTSDTDAAGGGGAGGSVFVTAQAGTGAGLRLLATGGAGGSSLYFNHGPGGGGGGGYIVTSLAAAAPDVAGGLNGTDGCCSGTGGNGSPKPYNATSGTGGVTSAAGGSAQGVQGGAACLPAIAVTKSTTTPTLTSVAGAGATASYSIGLVNTGGAASNVFVLDQTLPPGWSYTAATAPVFTYSPPPPPAANAPAAGAETVSAAAPGALPVNTLASANAGGPVSLRPVASAPGVTPTTGGNALAFGSFYLPQNGAITVTFSVSIPATATVGTYHNPGSVIFLDPTRLSNAARMVTPLAASADNRTATAYSNTTYASGATANVQGINYSGLQGGPAGENVTLLADFSITKTAPATATSGATFSYVVTARNNGWAVASQSYATTQATDVAAAAVPAAFGSNPLTVTDTLPSAIVAAAPFTGTGWTCTGTSTQSCTLANASAYPIAANSNFATLTGVVTVSAACGSTPRTNTAQVSLAAGEADPVNNTATVTTAIGCANVNLQVAKSNNTTVLVAGSTTSYTVTVANLGPDAATNATLSDSAGTGLSCTTATCSGVNGALCPAPSIPFGSLTAGLQIPALPAGSTATFVVTCGVTATGQ